MDNHDRHLSANRPMCGREMKQLFAIATLILAGTCVGLRGVAAQTAADFPTHVPLDKRELDIWKHEQILGRIDAIRDSIIKLDESKLEMRNAECVLAIGHQGFCDCLNEYLPIRLSLEDYVHWAIHMEVVGKTETGTRYSFDKSLGLSDLEERATFAAGMTCKALAFSSKK
jgi:hypothetical protein